VVSVFSGSVEVVEPALGSDGVGLRPGGYAQAMSTHEKEPPIELPDAAEEESISPADAAERLEQDPEEQPNYTDRPPADRNEE
jgi:hypothetical protein